MRIFDFLKKKKDNIINNNNKKNNFEKLKTKKLNYFDDIYMRCLYKYNLNIDELAQYYSNNICISCGCVLDNEIKKTCNCPECKNKIVVKTDAYSKRKVILNQEIVNTYEKYDKEVRDILFMERIMNKKVSIYNKYINKFKLLKANEKFSARDIMYQFVNYVGSELDNKAYKQYMYSLRLAPQDRVLKSFDAIMDFRKANQEYATLYSICIYEEKYNVAISLLTDVIYRDIQIVVLDNESNPYHKPTNEDFINNIRINQIKELINKSSYTLTDIKKIFLEQRHPFILSKTTNEDAWKYVEMAIKRFGIN